MFAGLFRLNRRCQKPGLTEARWDVRRTLVTILSLVIVSGFGVFGESTYGVHLLRRILGENPLACWESGLLHIARL